MSLVIVETLADYPLTPEEPSETDLRVLACLAERNVTWRYSLLSIDRQRMICTFDAPDAESVRQSYRKGGGGFQGIWSADIIQPEGSPQRDQTLLKVFESTYSDNFTQADWDAASQKMLRYFAERGIEWVRTYLSLDRTRMVCELNAANAELIREAHQQFGIPCDRVWSARVLRPEDM